VKDYVRLRRLRQREMFVPLVHPPGEAQADFGEAQVVISGEKRKAHYLVIDLPQSDACFIKAYLAETTEGHCHVHPFYLSELAISAAIVSTVVVAARLIWLYPATYLPRWLFPSIKRRDPSPPWQWPFVLAFTGVRGIVSLAAALAIPFATTSGQPFPDRDLILFLTFSVI